MNKLVIIGNLTRDPELRQTQEGVSVCAFTASVNRRVRAGEHPEADYFRVTAWRQLGELCAKYLAKGRKVAAWGPVTASAYTDRDGKSRAGLELTAEGVEFLSPREREQRDASGMEIVPPEDLPEDMR